MPKGVPKKKPFLNCDDSKSINYDISDYEVLFTFYDDHEALSFREWWIAIGNFEFQKFLDDKEVSK